VCAKVENCLIDIQSWPTINFLEGHPVKTEIQVLGTPQRIKAIGITSLSVAGVEVNIAEGSVRNLGVHFRPTTVNEIAGQCPRKSRKLSLEEHIACPKPSHPRCGQVSHAISGDIGIGLL
jgi:hypothetical protein